MPIQFAVRRTTPGAGPGVPGQQQFLFLVADTLNISTQEQVIAPTLPLNDSANVAGSSIPNFSLNIGMHKQVIQARGIFVDLEQRHFPLTLPGNDYDQTTTPPTRTSTLTTSTYLPGATTTRPNHTDSNKLNRPTAKNMRSMALNFFVDQRSYSDISLCWPGWLDDEVVDYWPDGMIIDPNASGPYHPSSQTSFDAPAGATTYRLWRGHILNFSSPQISYEQKQFPWSLTFGVGKPLSAGSGGSA